MPSAWSSAPGYTPHELLDMTRPRALWWWLPLAAAFVSYFALVFYCDLVRPETGGLDLVPRDGRIVIDSVAPGSPAERAGLEAGDVLAAMDGRAIVDAWDWVAVAANLQFGRQWTIDIERGGRPLSFTIWLGWEGWRHLGTRAGRTLIAIRVVLAIALGLGLFVVFRRPQDPVALTGGWLLASLGVFSVVWPFRIAAIWREVPSPLDWLLWLPFFSSWSVGALLFVFFTLLSSRRRQAWSFWIPALLPMAVSLVAFAPSQLALVYSPSSALSPSGWRMNLLVATNLAYIVAAHASLAWTYQHLKGTNERRRVRIVAAGSFVGWIGGVAMTMGYWFARVDPTEPLFASTPAAIGALLFVAVPASFAYAILRHRLFDVRVMIRRGARYAVARIAYRSFVPVLGLVVLLDLLLHGDQPLVEILRTRALPYALLAGLGIVFTMRRRQWLEALDRRFFRERYDAQAVLAQIATDLRRAPDFGYVAPRAAARLDEALHPEFVAVLLRRRGAAEYATAASVPSGLVLPRLPAGSTFMRFVRVLEQPLDLGAAGSTWLRDQLPESDRTMLRQAGIEVVVPVATRPDDDDDALLLLGTKKSEEPYTKEDLGLLTAVAGTMALRLERRDAEPPGRTTFEECPACGTCYDAGAVADRCPSEGARLTPVRLHRELASRYRLDRRIGRGGMGTVYAARDLALDRQVAVKVMREDLVGSPEAAERFRGEARAAARFSHPHVVTVHDFGLTAERVGFIVMELLDGVSLRDASHGAALLPSRTLAIVRQVGSAIDAAHQQRLIHRDLKPENLVLVRDGGGELAKVLDFGIAKFISENVSEATTSYDTAPGRVVGTPLYMAPEQLRRGDPSTSWDLWALAIMACEMLTGGHPLARAAAGDIGTYEACIHDHLCDTPPAWQGFFADALAVDAVRRPATVDALVEGLGDAIARG